MTSNTTVLPLRSLTPDKEKAIENFYTPASASGLFLATYLPVVLGLSLGGAFFTATQGLIIGVVIAIILVLLRRRKIQKNIRQAKFVYQYGSTEQLTFDNISSNYSFKVNGAPQQVISIRQNGQPTQIKTFNPNVLAVYSLPQQTAYIHPEHPGVVVPEGLFSLQWPKKRSGFSLFFRRALLFGLPFLFVIGLTYFISGEMDSNSETHAQPDALIYRQDGKLVLATAISRFKAYEVSNKGTYGDDYYYAEGIDLGTGKPLWKVSLDANNSEGNNGGAVRLLGQSLKYLFFLRNELYVIDKESGKVIAQNKDFKNISSHMSKEVVMSYEDEANYTWSDSLGAVVVKGTDGLFYTINGMTLQTNTIDNITDPDAFFKNRFKYGNNFEDQVTAVYDDGTFCYTLLDTQDTVLLAHNSYGVQSRPAEQSVRRMFYKCASDRMSDGWMQLNQNVFLSGGFLVDATQRFEQPEDTIAKYASYQSLTARYNGSNPPMRTGNGGFLILHKTTIEPSATLLLTAVSATGTTLWQVSTGYGSLPLMYKDAVNNKLYVCGNEKGGVNDDLNQVLCIDLATGAVVKEEIE